MELDEDSVDVVIQMPKEQRNRVAITILNWQFDLSADQPHHLRLYFCANEVYIRNLIAKREQPRLNQEQKRKVLPGTIVYQAFQGHMKEPNGKDEESVQYDGELFLVYVQYKGLELNLKICGTSLGQKDYLAAKFLLCVAAGEDPKPRTLRLAQNGEIWSCLIEESEFDKFLKSRLAFEVIIQRQNVYQTKFVGIKNEGNTCYMNSVLQILYFIRILRQNIISYDGNGKVIKALRQAMLCLMHGPASSQGPIDAEMLIEAYGRFADYPRRQQDTQQFLLGFLQELQSENASLAQLWQGECIQVLQSIEQDKPYTSRVRQDFSGLDLPLEDLRGNTFAHLIQALQHLLDKQRVEDKIDSDDYGKIAVQKSREFTKLPPVLFLTLKRYKFKKGTHRPVKILADLNYPEKINFGFLLGTATGDDMDYLLFAVTVHRGQHYSSGHYYSFVNTSTNQNQPYWVRFDDSRVTLASTSQALSFSGGKRRYMAWDKDYQKFREKEYLAEDTGYVLVYYRKELFREYQKSQVQIPRTWLNERRKTKVREEVLDQEGMMQVQVYVSNLQPEFDPFGDTPTFPIGLRPNEDVVTQIHKLNSNFLGCKVGSVWKVHKAGKKIKHLVQFADLPQTALRVFGFKTGHRLPDYLLILPASTPTYQRIQTAISSKKLGLVRQSLLTEIVPRFQWRLIEKNSLEELLFEEEKKYEKKGFIEEKDVFNYDWNDICYMVFD